MKGLIKISIDRPVGVTMLLAALILSGFIAISVVPVNRLPEIQIPRVQVTAGYPGLSAKDIRRALTIPIEDALASVR